MWLILIFMFENVGYNMGTFNQFYQTANHYAASVL
jgi:hypothetical protein